MDFLYTDDCGLSLNENYHQPVNTLQCFPTRRAVAQCNNVPSLKRAAHSPLADERGPPGSELLLTTEKNPGSRRQTGSVQAGKAKAMTSCLRNRGPEDRAAGGDSFPRLPTTSKHQGAQTSMCCCSAGGGKGRAERGWSPRSAITESPSQRTAGSRARG